MRKVNFLYANLYVIQYKTVKNGRFIYIKSNIEIGMNMIYINIDNLDYYDDANVLVKSFYPRSEVELKKPDTIVKEEDTVIFADTSHIAGSKKECHEQFKRKLYEHLVKQTKNVLPWGYLTGVRPSKIAYMMLEQQRSEECIIDEFVKNHSVSEKKAKLALQVASTEKTILDKLDYKHGYSLYIGIPFCPTTCLYCSFTSYSITAFQSKVDDYIDALVKEMCYVAKAMSKRRLDTVYIGGGTPTSLEPVQLERLLSTLECHFDMEHIKEFTVEAGRPDSITLEKLEVLKKHGVQRISINPQTMNDETLAVIGRKHNVASVTEAFDMARNVGFDNINMDIILGLPGEGKKEVEQTLKRIYKLHPESLTVHSLAIKRAAALNIGRDKYANFRIENSEELVSMAADYAAMMGQKPYYMYRQKNMAGNLENVGYAIPAYECIYNILIMEEKQTIIAVGAGASSKVVLKEESQIERVENVKDVMSYIDRIDEMIARKERFIKKYGVDLNGSNG